MDTVQLYAAIQIGMIAYSELYEGNVEFCRPIVEHAASTDSFRNVQT